MRGLYLRPVPLSCPIIERETHMPENKPASHHLLFGLAAVIAAVALLIFSLAYAGLFGLTPKAIAPTVSLDGTAMVVTGPPPAAQPSKSADTPPPPTDSAPTSALPATSGTASDSAGYPGAGTSSETSAGGAASGAALSAGDTGIVEDWQAYTDDRALQKAFDTNTAVPTNTLALSHLVASASPHGPAGVSISYTIVAGAPDDYAGFDRDLKPVQDWTGRRQLVAWVQSPERSARQLVLQWYEASGEVWRHRTRLADVPADGRLVIPFAPAAWEWADWSTHENGKLDLGKVVHFGVFIGHAGPGAGTVRLGTIEVER